MCLTRAGQIIIFGGIREGGEGNPLLVYNPEKDSYRVIDITQKCLLKKPSPPSPGNQSNGQSEEPSPAEEAQFDWSRPGPWCFMYCHGGDDGKAREPPGPRKPRELRLLKAGYHDFVLLSFSLDQILGREPE